MFEECRQRLQPAATDELFRGFAHDTREVRESIFRDLLAANLDSLSDGNQMRRSEQARANSRGATDRIKERGRRSFPICAGDLN